MNQNVNGTQIEKKDDTLKLVFIIIGVIAGIGIIFVVGFVFLLYTVFKNSVEYIDETKEEVNENYNDYITSDNDNSSSSGNENGDEVVIEYSNIEKISFNRLKDMIDNKRSFVLVVSQTYCSHCIEFKPIFNEVMKDNDTIGFELDLLTLAKSEYADFNNTLEVTGTPTTFVFIDGVVQKEELSGYVKKDVLIAYLKKYGFIK